MYFLIDNGLTKASENFSGGTLRCHCLSNRVKVAIRGSILNNHACGCSPCWKPAGALFIVGVVPIDNVKVVANSYKLKVLDSSAVIQRYACTQCVVHLFGRIEKKHAVKGLGFIHVELSDEKGWQEPQFVAFVSSTIEQGFDRVGMDAVHSKFKSIGLEPYDVLSPSLMDAISKFTLENAGKLSKEGVG